MIYTIVSEWLGYSSTLAGALNAAAFFLIIYFGYFLADRSKLEIRSIILFLFPIGVFLVGTVHDWALMGGLYVVYLVVSYINKRFSDKVGMLSGAIGLVALGVFLTVFDLFPNATDECIKYGAGILSTC